MLYYPIIFPKKSNRKSNRNSRERENIMAKVCDISGRHAQAGRWTRHPHSGSWAHRAPQKPRRFQVNLQNVTIQTPKGKIRIKVAARMLTSKNFQAIIAGQRQLPAHLLK